MPLPKLTLPKLSDHGGELALLAAIALGVIVLMGMIIQHAADAKTALADVSPFLLILQAIISAIKDRWASRAADAANDRSATLLAAAPPMAGNIAGTDQGTAS